MAANTLTARTAGGNSGVPSQEFNIGKIIGIILADPTFSVSTTNCGTSALFITALAAASLVVGTGRIYPIANLDNPTDNSSDPEKTTSDYGVVRFADDGSIDLTFEFMKGGHELNKNLRKFNERSMGFLLVNEYNQVIGTTDSTGVLKPFTGTVNIFFPKMATGSEVNKYRINLVWDDVTELADDLLFMQCSVDVMKTVKGIVDVTILETAHNATTVTVKLTTAYGAIDMFGISAAYETALETPANWRLYPVAGGADVVPSGIVYTAPTGTDTVGTAVITHASLSASHYLSLDTPTVLAAAGIGGTPNNGYESNTITVAYT